MGLSAFLPTEERRRRLEERLKGKLHAFGEYREEFWISIPASAYLAAVELLRSDPELAFDSFVDLCGVDYLERQPRFEVVTHLFSQVHLHRIRIRCLVPDDTLTVPSLTRFWKGANWQEREAYDMYGIRFEGHPNLERILNPPDETAFPQRKDYPLKGSRGEMEDL